MKTKIMLLGLIGLPILALAQVEQQDLPSTVADFWTYGIALVTPIIVTGVYKTVPKIPKWILPSITPLIGILLGLALNTLANVQLSWVDTAKAGALAVFIREVINQAITKQLANKTPEIPAS